VQTIPDLPPVSQTEVEAPPPARRSAELAGPPRPEKGSLNASGSPLSGGLARPKRAPVPLPSRLKKSPANTTAKVTHKSPTKISEPPPSDTQVDMPVPPNRKRP
jgi:hypothetical protein